MKRIIFKTLGTLAALAVIMLSTFAFSTQPINPSDTPPVEPRCKC